MPKILVSESEYMALKRAAALKSPLPEPAATPPPSKSSSELASGESVAEKLDDINKDMAEKENEERREVLEPDKVHSEHELAEFGADGDREESQEVQARELAFFLPSGKRQEAVYFLRKLVPHPAVGVESGVVFVRGKQIGHIVSILSHLFGEGKSAVKDKMFLDRFLCESGIYKRKRRRTSAKKSVIKKANNSEERKKYHASRKLDPSVFAHLK